MNRITDKLRLIIAKDIAKASAGSVISLAKTLHVEPGDLII